MQVVKILDEVCLVYPPTEKKKKKQTNKQSLMVDVDDSAKMDSWLGLQIKV